ncbi:MAG: hypothetical protein RBS96_05445 [Dehalococcoidales bacterium]|nr:hypothetical protein [Dehalococcoidales bacterium]
MTEYIGEGGFDINALFESYDLKDKIVKMKRIIRNYGLRSGTPEHDLAVIMTKIIDYCDDLSDIFKSMDCEDIKAPESDIKPKSDYKQLLHTIRMLCGMNIQNFADLSIYDAHNLITLEDDGESVEELRAKVLKKINASERSKERRQHLWDNWTEEDKNNKTLLKRFIESKDI